MLLLSSLPALVQAQTTVTEYYHLDALGTVRAVTDQSGMVVERHDYLPYGEEWCEDQVCAHPTQGQPLKFTGKERDVETGLDYFGARYYGSQIGRFTTVDPYLDTSGALFNPQRWNRYAYGLNNALRYVDPDGRQTVPQPGTLDQIFAYFHQVVGLNYQPAVVMQEGQRPQTVGMPDKKTVGQALIVAGGVAVAADAVASAAESKNAKEGRYEFPDQAAGGTPYVGQSGNIPRRLRDHERAGRLTPGSEATTEVPGGKTAREIAEHKRIQEMTGGVPASRSDKVSNKVDPIGPNRAHLLEEKK